MGSDDDVVAALVNVGSPVNVAVDVFKLLWLLLLSYCFVENMSEH